MKGHRRSASSAQAASMTRLLKRRRNEKKACHAGSPVTFDMWRRLCCDMEPIRANLLQKDRE